jgi:hypothetical protein
MCRWTDGRLGGGLRPPSDGPRGVAETVAVRRRLRALPPLRLGPLRGGLAVAGLLFAAGEAGADVVVERVIRSGGFAGMGGFESKSVTTTGMAAQREETAFNFSGSFLAALQKMAGAGDSIRITRLDRDLVWSLDPEKKTYTETPLTARGERDRRAPGAPPPRPERREPSDVVVTRNELSVEATGEKKTINEFPCDRYKVSWILETRNQKTGETGRSTMTRDLWTTPETDSIRAALAEETAYARAYLEKIQLPQVPAEIQKAGLQALAGGIGLDEAEQQKLMAQLRTEMAKIRGFEISSQTDWRVETPGGSAPPAPSAGAPPAGSQQDLATALGKLFGGGAKPGDPAKPGERPPLFSLYSEVKSLRLVPAQVYEVPAGFTRK